jgi:predicted nucleic acid-binding protein
MYFYDSYALIEILKGNSNFDKFISSTPTCINQNLFELHQFLLREFNKKTADYWLNNFDYILIEITKEDIIEASDFRLKHKNQRLSMTDCLGYVIAKRKRIKFLTGDKEFEGLDNVEFMR